MNYHIEVENHQDLLKFHLTGSKKKEIAKKIWQDIIDYAQKEKINKLLIIDNMKDDLEIIDVLELSNWFNEISFPRDIKIALVDPNLLSEVNRNSFGEDVIHNRGYHNIHVFSDEESALEWLRPF